MKKRCRATGLVLVLSVFTLTMLPRAASAAGGDFQGSMTPSQRDAQLLQAFAPGEIQQVRDQLNTIMADFFQIQTLNGHPPSQAETARFKSSASSLRDVDIARWLAAGADLAPLKRAADDALAKTAAAEPRAQKGVVSPATTAGFPTAQYGSTCSGYTSNSDVVFGYQTALNIAKLIWIPLKDACDEVLVVVGEGGNTSLACIIPDEILQAAELILAQYTICDGDTQGAQVAANYDRLAYINEQIDTDYNATVSNDNSNKNAIVANDNANKNAIVANDNANKNAIVANDNSNAAATQANDNANAAAIIANDNTNTATILTALQNAVGQITKAQWEANLASSDTPVGSYEIPVANGGQLENIRDLVAATISNMLARGMSVGTAATYLSMGNTYLAAHQYKLAFARYRAAYQQAVN